MCVCVLNSIPRHKLLALNYYTSGSTGTWNTGMTFFFLVPFFSHIYLNLFIFNLLLRLSANIHFYILCPTTTVPFVLLYIASTILASASGTPIHHRYHPSASCRKPFRGKQILLTLYYLTSPTSSLTVVSVQAV